MARYLLVLLMLFVGGCARSIKPEECSQVCGAGRVQRYTSDPVFGSFCICQSEAGGAR